MAILGMLVLLWRSIATTSESAPVEPRPAPVAERPAPAANAPAATGPVLRSPLPPVRTRPSNPPPTTADAPPPALENEQGAPGTRLNTKNLDYGMPQMRALVAANEPQVTECLRRAAAAGDKPTGDAQLTFIAAKRGDQIVVEETGVDHDQTTLKSEALLECLHGTSKMLQFAGLPREADAVIVTRSVRVENGGLVENSVVKFSYIR